MTWQESALEVAMRIPGLYLIDCWWRSPPLDPKEIIDYVLTNLLLLHGFMLLILPLPQVQALYRHLLCGAPLVVIYFLMEHSSLKALSQMQLLAVLLAACLVAAYLLPCYCPLVMSPFMWWFLTIPSLPSTLLFSYCYAHFPAALSLLKLALTFRPSHWMTLISALWKKIFEPTHFALYWLFLFCAKLSTRAYMVKGAYIRSQEWYLIALAAASAVCDSPVNLLATAFAISYISFFILSFTKIFLEGSLGASIDNPQYEGRTESFIFLVLSIQTSFMEKNLSERIGFLTIMLFLISASILQSMLEITEPVMLALSAGNLRSFPAHLRAFTLALVLFVLPLYLTHAFVHLFTYHFWQITVLSRFILTAFHDLDLFMVYGLFLYDRAGGWEGLDDAVYIARATHKVLEFIVAVVCMIIGLSGGFRSVLNLAILGVHCYFNIWLQLQDGWHSYMLRREAVKKSEELKEATPEMLARFNDVCSICYTSMESKSCSTPCQHCFHRYCLKKWLYIQDKCPLCHESITLCT